MSQWELMKLMDSFDGEISEADFTIEEMEEALGTRQNDLLARKRRYFEHYNDVKSPSLKKQDW